MKKRQGFVSNSSTSSFCIYGISIGSSADIGSDNWIDALKKFKSKSPELLISRIDGVIDKIKSRSNGDISDYNQKRIDAYNLVKNIDSDELFADQRVRGCEHDIDENTNFCSECGNPVWRKVENKNLEILKDLLDDETGFLLVGLECHAGSYVGRSWCTVGDEETGAEFKKSVENAVKLLSLNGKCSTIEEAWYNG